MFQALTLPWWAIAYLLLFFGLTFADALLDIKERPTALFGDFMSFVFACICVFSYFDIGFAKGIGYWLIPMVVIGVAWEFSQSVVAAERAENEMKTEGDIAEEDRSMLLNIGVGMGALIVLPAYMMGLKTCFDLFFPASGG